MNIITLDWETYFDQDYTLKKLSTTEYIRHAEFQIHGVGIKKTSGKAAWYTGDKLFDRIYGIDWENTALLCHHTQFDAFILTHWFRVKPAYYLCTFSMARALLGPAYKHGLDSLAEHFGIGRKIPDVLDQVKGQRSLEPKLMRALGAYCRQDVELTWSLFKNHLRPDMPQSELDIIDETVRMYAEPVLRIDSEKVKHYWVLQRQKKRRLLRQANIDEDIVQSNPKFAEALKQLNVEIPYKVSPRTGKKTFAFAQDDVGFKLLARHRDPKVKTLVKARLACKSTIGETRAQRLLTHADGTTLPVYYNYYGAHTGRHSGGDKVNLQNLENGTDLRRSILAPDGYLLGVGDSKQIEARTNAWFCGQDDLLEEFRQGKDPYKRMAASIFSKPIDKINDKQRFVGKTAILQLGYGAGSEGFCASIRKKQDDFSNFEAALTVSTYRNVNWHIEEMWGTLKACLQRMCEGQSFDFKMLRFEPERVILPNGMALIYKDLSLDNNEFTYLGRPDKRFRLYGGKLLENIIQALARIIVFEQKLIVAKRHRVLMSTHDELVTLLNARHSKKGLAFLKETLSQPPDWAPDLPLGADISCAREYSK